MVLNCCVWDCNGLSTACGVNKLFRVGSAIRICIPYHTYSVDQTEGVDLRVHRRCFGRIHTLMSDPVVSSLRDMHVSDRSD